jgi:hypothetical protein
MQSIKTDVKIINTICIAKYYGYYYFMEPGVYQDAPLINIPHFIWSVGFLGGWNRGMHDRSLMVVVQGPGKAHPLFIHIFIMLIKVEINTKSHYKEIKQWEKYSSS